MKTLLFILCNMLLMLSTISAQYKENKINNPFDYHPGHDLFYWEGKECIMAKTPLRMTNKWEEIKNLYNRERDRSLYGYPYFDDKNISCHWHLVDGYLLCTCAYPYPTFDNETDSINRIEIFDKLEELLPGTYSHEWDEMLRGKKTERGKEIEVGRKGAMLVTWVDSLDVRDIKTYRHLRKDEDYETKNNRLDVHPYLRLYFKEGVLTNIKFITPKVKEE